MVTQAIIPLAGLGTRLLPLSSVIPKELLPINGKPNLEYIMEECIEAGIKQFIFVVQMHEYVRCKRCLSSEIISPLSPKRFF